MKADSSSPRIPPGLPDPAPLPKAAASTASSRGSKAGSADSAGPYLDRSCGARGESKQRYREEV